MTDNTRQEAVERVVAAWEPAPRIVDRATQYALAGKAIDASDLVQQLAAERALCDRLAVMLRAANILLDEHGVLDDCITIEDVLADYDAHRAAEPVE